MKKLSKFGLFIASVYIVLVIIALLFLIIMHTYHPEKSEFAGVYIIILTFPWSFAILKPLGAYVNSITLLISLFIGCAIVNAVILYWFGNKIEKNW